MTEIISVIGSVGHGKTFLSTCFALNARANDRKVFANYHIKGINCMKLGQPYEPNHYYISSPDQLSTIEFPRNSLVVLDEAYTWCDARLSMGVKGKKEDMIKFTHVLLQSRKKHFETLHTEQIFKTVDNRLQQLTTVLIIPRPIASLKLETGELVNCAFIAEIYECFQGKPIRLMHKLKFPYPLWNKVRAMYDTDESVEVAAN